VELQLREGDLRCLAHGHLTRSALSELAEQWDGSGAVDGRLATARATLRRLSRSMDLEGALAQSSLPAP